MILVLYDGSILLKSSGGSFGMGSPQYAQLVDSGSLGMPHVSQVIWLEFSCLFTGLGLKHMVVSLLYTPVCRFAARFSPVRAAFCFSHIYTNAISFRLTVFNKTLEWELRKWRSHVRPLPSPGISFRDYNRPIHCQYGTLAARPTTQNSVYNAQYFTISL